MKSKVFARKILRGDVGGILKQLLAPDNAQKIFCNCLATLRLNYLIPPLPKTLNKRINFRTEFKIKELFFPNAKVITNIKL